MDLYWRAINHVKEEEADCIKTKYYYKKQIKGKIKTKATNNNKNECSTGYSMKNAEVYQCSNGAYIHLVSGKALRKGDKKPLMT